ncbi:hypothetical protein WJX75_000788 [Coccomyxa subellipsoidea]|uniref:Uncharacterized protein n=1 Tax=Coccomyxa subellipsoidea TaxID=248742 RepID=A0ABR2YIS2_9CHLO
MTCFGRWNVKEVDYFVEQAGVRIKPDMRAYVWTDNPGLSLAASKSPFSSQGGTFVEQMAHFFFCERLWMSILWTNMSDLPDLISFLEGTVPDSDISIAEKALIINAESTHATLSTAVLSNTTFDATLQSLRNRLPRDETEWTPVGMVLAAVRGRSRPGFFLFGTRYKLTEVSHGHRFIFCQTFKVRSPASWPAPTRSACVLLLVATSLLALTSLASAQNANFNFNLDVNKVGDPIANAVSGQGNADRAGFVKNQSNTCFYQEGQKYNCMVFNVGQNYQWTNQ